MKQIYFGLIVLASAVGYSQESKISSELTLAVKEIQRGKANLLDTPDFAYYNKNYDSLLSGYGYTSDILDIKSGSIYVDGDKLYSNQYIPIVLQQHQANLTVDNYYRMEKMYAQPDPVNTRNR